ncbi:MAG: rimJ2, partial [Frankiales bacterium]|nr:rimJ2 [Frankiales bacterium]
ALNAAVVASRAHLRPWMPWADASPMTTAERRAWFAAQTAAGDLLFGAWHGGELVGAVGLHRRIDPGGMEIGYWVHVDHVRRGFATEMARQACAIAFASPNVTHVEIHHDVANAPSGRVAAALGFTVVAEVPSRIKAPGGKGVDRVWRLERP